MNKKRYLTDVTCKNNFSYNTLALNQDSCEFWMSFMRNSPYIFNFGNMLTKAIVGNFISFSTFTRIFVKCCPRRYVECDGRYTVWVFIPIHQMKRLYGLLTTVNHHTVLNIGITCISYMRLLDDMVSSLKMWACTWACSFGKIADQK